MGKERKPDRAKNHGHFRTSYHVRMGKRKIHSYRAVFDEDRQIVMEEADTFEVDGDLRYWNPADVYRFASRHLKMDRLAEEHVYVLCLDATYHIKAVFETGHAGESSCAVPLRETFRKALLLSASCIMLLHNHPGGSARPSAADKKLTEQILRNGAMLSIPLADHIIIGNRRYYSFAMNWHLSHKDAAESVPKPLLGSVKTTTKEQKPAKPSILLPTETPGMLWKHISQAIKASRLPVNEDRHHNSFSWHGEGFVAEDGFLRITAPADDGGSGTVSWTVHGKHLDAPYTTYDRFATLMDWFMEEAGLVSVQGSGNINS